jgi:hypothetical protein
MEGVKTNIIMILFLTRDVKLLKKKWLPIALGSFITAGSLFTPFSSAFAASPSFDDIGDHWAESQIRSLASQGVINGIDSNTFAPDKPLTKGEFAAMLAKAMKSELKTSASPGEARKYFSDVDSSDYYASDLVRLKKANIIDDHGAFHGEGKISRQEMAHYLVNGYNYLYQDDLSSLVNTNHIPFKDADQISSGYKDDVVIADKINLIGGKNDGSFAPRASLTRGEAAAVIYRFIQLVPYEDIGLRASTDLPDKFAAYYKEGKLYITFTYDLKSAGYNGQIIVITRSGKQLKINVDQVKLDNSSSSSGFEQMRTIAVKESGVSQVLLVMNGKETARFNVK